MFTQSILLQKKYKHFFRNWHHNVYHKEVFTSAIHHLSVQYIIPLHYLYVFTVHRHTTYIQIYVVVALCITYIYIYAYLQHTFMYIIVLCLFFHPCSALFLAYLAISTVSCCRLFLGLCINSSLKVKEVKFLVCVYVHIGYWASKADPDSD